MLICRPDTWLAGVKIYESKNSLIISEEFKTFRLKIVRNYNGLGIVIVSAVLIRDDKRCFTPAVVFFSNLSSSPELLSCGIETEKIITIV